MQSRQDSPHIYKYPPIILQAVIYCFSWLLFRIFADFKVTGFENIKNLKGPLIFAPNHASEWDGILMRVALPFFSRLSPMYYVAMSDNEYVNSGWRNMIYGGKIFEALGAYPRYSGKKDYSHSLRNFIKILKGGGIICIFPEGRRTKTGLLSEAHGGVAYLAEAANAPVVPVAIKGLVRFKVIDLLMGKREVSINIGKIIEPSSVINNSEPEEFKYKKGAEFVMQKVRELF